jgi:hypothetical protein
MITKLIAIINLCLMNSLIIDNHEFDGKKWEGRR